MLFLGVGLPGDRIHAPNERMVMDQFWKGLLAAGELLVELGGREVRSGAAGPKAGGGSRPAAAAGRPERRRGLAGADAAGPRLPRRPSTPTSG